MSKVKAVSAVAVVVAGIAAVVAVFRGLDKPLYKDKNPSDPREWSLPGS